MPLLDPHFATRRRLKAMLVVAGGSAGFVFGTILTRLAKIAAGAPPATFGEYAWNGAWFAALAAVVSPIVSWSFLRRAPLWRTIVEPLLWAVAAVTTALIVGAPVLILMLPPVGLTLGFLNLRRRYPDRPQAPVRGADRDTLRPSPEALAAGADEDQ